VLSSCDLPLLNEDVAPLRPRLRACGCVDQRHRRKWMYPASNVGQLACGVSIRRTRRISPRWIWLLRPLFRYSRTIGGYVFRAGGRSRGPILQPKQKDKRLPTISPLVEHPPSGDPRNPWPSLVGEDVDDRQEDGHNGRAALAGASEGLNDSDEDSLPESGDEIEPRISLKLTVGKGLMRPYNEANPCPKCGSTQATVQYHDPATEEKGCDPGEHIHRECLTCGYPWSDACLELS
jgi:hypothetical protein